MKLMDALNRIERAGSENSAATRKLREAAEVVLEDLTARSKRISPSIWLDFGARKYEIGQGAVQMFRSNNDGKIIAYTTSVGGGKLETRASVTRQQALDFASDMAAGLLDRLAEAAEARNLEDLRAAGSLQGQS